MNNSNTVMSFSSNAAKRWALRYRHEDIHWGPGTAVEGLLLSTIGVTDTWGAQPALLHCITPRQGGSLPVELCEAVVDRSKSLRSFDQAHLQPIRDYCLDESQAFYWVTDNRESIPLAKWLDTHKMSDEQGLELVTHYVGGLVYLESLAPHVVPSIAQDSVAILSDGKLYLKDFHLNYLLGGIDDSATRKQIALFITQVCSCMPASKYRDELNELSVLLASATVGKDLSTIHKIRASIKHIAQNTGRHELKLGEH